MFDPVLFFNFCDLLLDHGVGFVFQAEDGIRDLYVTGVQTCALPISSGEDKGDLLSMLLAARDEDGSRMNDRQLRDEVMTLFLAGHETTALTLAWSWYL